MARKWLFLVLLLVMMASACAPAQPAAPAEAENPPAADPTATTPAAAPAATEPAATEPAATEPAATEAAAPVSTEPIARAITSEPTGLDPMGVAGAAQNVLLPFLFDTLVYRDMDNSYQPFLAERWEVSDDGKQVTFFLRPGITFHDGTPLNAEAVKANFDRIREQGQKSVMASVAAQIENITAMDERTVRFEFTAPSSTLFSSLSNPYAGIVSPTAVQSMGEGFAQKPVGSGPYMFDSWEPGVGITLVRNPNYAWAPPSVQNRAAPLTERLVFKVIPDSAQQMAAYQAGELDVLFVNQPSHVAKLQADPDTELHETVLNSLIYLGYNVRRAPFDDLRVRKAVSHAVNKDELVATALGGIGEPAFAPLAPTLPGFDPALKEYELGFNLEQSAALMTEAGFTQGADGVWTKDGAPLTLTLLTSTRPPNPALATVLQSQLKAAGINMEVQALDSAAVSDAANEGNFDLFLWRYDWNDADVLRVYLSTDRIGRTNRTFYSNPDLDALLNQAATELDDTARNALYLQAQQMILEDAAWQPLYTPKDFIAVRKDVNGVVLGPMGRLLMNDAVKQ